MPERNLVKIAHGNRCFMMAVALTTAALQLGCSNLGQTTFKHDLLSGSRSKPLRVSDSSEMASDYINSSELDSVDQKDEARIVGLGDVDYGEMDVKLFASQPAPTIDGADTNSSNSVNDLFCEHTAECDCHKPKVKPKLPHAEPIVPPPFASQAPPSGLVNQPLTPILLDSQSRAIQNNEVDQSNNSLRRIQPMSSEKTATRTNRSSEIDLGAVDSNPARPDASQAPIRKPMVTNGLNQGTPAVHSSRSELADIEVRAMTACVSCRSETCTGNCNQSTNRIAVKNAPPIVDSEPIIIVATTSTDTIPPFADCPPDAGQQVELAAATERVIAESTTRRKHELPKADPPSFDDLNDDDWQEIFGPMNDDGPNCQACQSSQCQDSACQIQTATKIADGGIPGEPGGDTATTKEVMVVENFARAPAPRIEDLRIDANLAQAGAIDSVPIEETGNDFQAVGHTSAVSENEIAWTQPSSPDVSRVAPTIEAGEPETQPATAELPMLDLGPVSVPDGGKSLPMNRKLTTYAGPPVRFEVIDNTVPWTEQLSATIQHVQSQLAIEDEPAARNGLEVNLRLLEVLQRQMADVEVRQDSLSDEEKQFWKHQLDAIALMLNPNDSADSDLARHHTAINTLEHLRKAVERLESIAELKITNGAFCTEVSGFGQFKTFPTTSFAPRQRMLVYCEVENYSTMQKQVVSQTQVHTRLRGSYVIYDQQGRAVQQAEYPIVEDIARKRRRDFYMYFPIQLEDLTVGQYKLELMVEDLNGNQTASVEPGLEFHVN